ncbi:MAG: aconitase family protein [Patescibacteria group bacterium]|nr:aconitase family protein [Patescibacteria group bacterium]
MRKQEIEPQSFKNRGHLALFPNESDLLSKQIQGNERFLLFSDGDVEYLLKGVSTDGIIPSKAAGFQKPIDLAPFALSGVPGIGEEAVRLGDFNVVIAGAGFGCGSSREHAPKALKGAGIDFVVVAGGKAEKIFKENCLFSGGPVILEVENADQLNLALKKIREKKTEDIETNQDPLRSLIIANGGLFNFNKKRLSGEINLPQIEHKNSPTRPMTAVEKILSKKMKNVDPDNPVVRTGDTGFAEVDLRFSYEIMTKMLVDLINENYKADLPALIIDKGSIFLFEDHLVWAQKEHFRRLINEQRKISEEEGLHLFKQKEGLPGSQGICHTLVLEKGLLLPGQVGIGTDSHTCSGGALGAFSFGVGTTAMANAFLTKEAFVEVPKTVKVEIEGELASDCSAKDVMLTLLSNPYVKTGNCIDKVFEFTGDGFKDWKLDQLFVLTNMAVEAGATTGIVTKPTEAVLSHLRKTSGKTKKELKKMFVRSDSDADFSHTIKIDLSRIEPMVALPGHPTNGVPLSELGKEVVTKGFIGSCTGGNLSDIIEAANVLSGEKVSVPLVIQPASMEIYKKAQKMGILDKIKESGAEVLMPGCGACIGMGPGKVENPDDVIISATNRNFPGRMGKPSVDGREVEGGKVYLASPRIVAQSSIRGYIANE